MEAVISTRRTRRTQIKVMHQNEKLRILLSTSSTPSKI